MPTIKFKSKVVKINSWNILKLPEDASKQLPSRGQVMVEGTINGFGFQSPLEPDGVGSHWLKITDAIAKGAKIAVGDTAELEIEPSKEWPEPRIPKDLGDALKAAPQKIQEHWQDITPMARWEWIRWIGGTANPQTREHRVEVSISKMSKGERRPCCFNRNMCMEPEVSKGGVLLAAA